MFEFEAGDMIVGRLHKEPVVLEYNHEEDKEKYPLSANGVTYTEYGFYYTDDIEPSIRLATGKPAEIGERPFVYPLYKRWKRDGEIAKFTALCTKEILVRGNQDCSFDVGTISTLCCAHTHISWEDCEDPETVYDGLTASQWNQVIREGLVCEFWDSPHPFPAPFDMFVLSKLEKGKFRPTQGTHAYEHCRIHISQPQFVIDGKKPDWLDDVVVSSLNRGGYLSTRSAKDVVWCDQVRFQVMAKL